MAADLPRALRRVGAAGAALLAAVLLRAPGVSANWTAPVGETLQYTMDRAYGSSGGSVQTCGLYGTPPAVGADWNGSGSTTTDYDPWGAARAIAIPAGATVISGSLSFSYHYVTGAWTTTPNFGVSSGPTGAYGTDACDTRSTGGSYAALEPGGSAYSGVAYGLALDLTRGPADVMVTGGYPGFPHSNPGNQRVALGPTLDVAAQYAFTPGVPAITQVRSGNAAQVTLNWAANGNTTDVPYELQRETLGPGGVVVGWTTTYTGTGTSWTTGDQSCGQAYIYRVRAAGAESFGGAGGATAWATTGEWDEFPCPATLAVSAASSTALSVSWGRVAPLADYVVVWCTNADCRQVQAGVGTANSAVLTHLAVNTSYAVWVCSTDNEWGCPVASVWTLANAPTGVAAAPLTGSTWNERLSWDANGNPAGTRYIVDRATWNAAGLVQGWTTIANDTTETGAATTGQTCARQYQYAVWAINGAGVATVWETSPDVENAPCAVTVAATGASTLHIGWSASAPSGADQGYTLIYRPAAGSTYTYLAVGAVTAYSLGGLAPNTAYSVWLMSTSGWWDDGATAWTAVAATGPPVATGLTQTGFVLHWAANGNPVGTTYHYNYTLGGVWQAEQATTGTSAALGGLPCGSLVGQTAVRAEGGDGHWGSWSYGQAVQLVPCAPAGFQASGGGLGWSASAGRGFVHLSWSAARGASGYAVWIWDGISYERFEVGDLLAWDSRAARVFPPDTTLYPNISEASRPAPVFSLQAGGLDLRDRPGDLYCSTGTYYCSPPVDHYWFGISAYNATGDSGAATPGGYACALASTCATPTLPLQTDPAPPVITDWSLNGGAAYAQDSAIGFALQARGGPSGIAAYALSNDGGTWQTTAVGACLVGQAAPCQGDLATSGTWTLPPGPGSKAVWVRVESAAGVWSTPLAASVYVRVDDTVPTVDVTLDGGAASTASTGVRVAVTVTDPATATPGLTWSVRYSTDGGQSWGAWSDEGQAVHWVAPWTLPAGASGLRQVLVQVENADHNLGQGSATIYYVRPPGGGAQGPPAPAQPCRWPLGPTTVAATCVTASQVTVVLAPPAGAVQMRISLNNVGWGPWQAAADSVSVDLGASPGARTVWAQFVDSAGNITAAGPLYYVYDPGGPHVTAGWAGDASATGPGGLATLELQASDAVGLAGLTVAVSCAGAALYTGPYRTTLPLQLPGAGYQLVHLALTNAAGTATDLDLGIYVQAAS